MMSISVPPVSVTGITLTSDMCALFVSVVRVPHALYLPFLFVLTSAAPTVPLHFKRSFLCPA